MQKVTTFLMFGGRAEEAMNLYCSLFEDAKIEKMEKYGEQEGATAGTVKHAIFSINGQQYMCIDSPVKHGFTFTPSISLYINCTSEQEIEKLFNTLSEGGGVMMPLGTYPFSKKFAWISDRFGVSWQLNLV